MRVQLAGKALIFVAVRFEAVLHPANKHTTSPPNPTARSGKKTVSFISLHCHLKYGLSQPILFMTVGELAKSFALRPSTLRFYERIGLLAPAGRLSGRRRYDQAGGKRLAFILNARESGFT